MIVNPAVAREVFRINALRGILLCCIRQIKKSFPATERILETKMYRLMKLIIPVVTAAAAIVAPLFVTAAAAAATEASFFEAAAAAALLLGL